MCSGTVVLLCVQLAKKISPSMDIGPLSAPYLLAPILAMAQQVNVSRPGEQPDPAQPIPEDMRLFDPGLVGANGEASVLCCARWSAAPGLLVTVLFSIWITSYICISFCNQHLTLLKAGLSGYSIILHHLKCPMMSHI